MINFLKQTRYHWQPDLAASVTYWSFTYSVLFLSLIFTLEKTHIYWVSFAIFFVFLLLLFIGSQRYFYFNDYGELVSNGLSKRHRGKFRVESLRKVYVSKAGIKLVSPIWEGGEIFLMRSWRKDAFIQAIAQHQEFQGKIEYVDELYL